jgi:hypothetical protein
MVFLLVISIFTFAVRKYYRYSEDLTKLGQFGDFIGGTLNPLLTFLTFCIVLMTLFLQRAELRESRIEMKRSAAALEKQALLYEDQKFESNFFQLLGMFNSAISSIDLRGVNPPDVGGRSGTQYYDIRGRDCFYEHYKILKFSYNQTQKEYLDKYVVPESESEKMQQFLIIENERIQKAYEDFWRDAQQDLGHYFRILYNIIRFIDESNRNPIPYIRILRSQLSDYELLLLFYNCHTETGKKMKIYVERFSLLNNLTPKLLLKPAHQDLFDPIAFDDFDE